MDSLSIFLTRIGERASASHIISIQFTQILPAHGIKNWRRILISQSSKTQLIKLSNTLLLTGERLGSKVLQLTCDEKCFRITHEAAVEVGELKTSQEEAARHLHYLACQVCFGLQINYFSS